MEDEYSWEGIRLGGFATTSVRPDTTRPPFASRSSPYPTPIVSLLLKKDIAAAFSSTRLLAVGSARLLTVVFSSVVAPHPLPSRAAPHSSPALCPHPPRLLRKGRQGGMRLRLCLGEGMCLRSHPPRAVGSKGRFAPVPRCTRLLTSP
jgi:hypothetical protein